MAIMVNNCWCENPKKEDNRSEKNTILVLIKQIKAIVLKLHN
jgi:hypothetical protein